MDAMNGAPIANDDNDEIDSERVNGPRRTRQKVDRPAALRILIAGAGIGGLSAALFLRHAGHTVEMYESSQFALEIGAAIHIPPNANGLLRRIGMIPEKHGAVTSNLVTVYGADGCRMASTDLRGIPKSYPYPWQLLHRVDLHSALKALALSADGKGEPVKIHLGNRVVDINSTATSMTFADGTQRSGDLIIVADGVHSQLRARLQVETIMPFASGSSAYRFLIPIDEIRRDPTTAHFVDQEGELFIFEGDNRRIAVYPCRNNTEMNFVCMHPDSLSEGSSEGWNGSASKESMLKVYEGFGEPIKTLLGKVDPHEIRLWKLLDCKPVVTWVKGKVALLGDAAHPFLPYQGQGGGQAIEDAAAMGALLPLGTEPIDIPGRLALYVRCRKERAETVQEVTRQSAYNYKDRHATEKPLFQATEFAEYNFNHDAYHYATGILRRSICAQLPYRRMPIAFGPTASPRQTLQGKIYDGTVGSTYVTTHVTFRTPKSFLETLLPTDGYKIQCQGGWARASFSHTKLGNLKWLGGRGYSHFGFYIHDVSLPTNSNLGPDGLSEKGSQPDTGDYLPVVFENLADPIITGREELGFSKIFANISHQSETKECSVATVRAGWGGLDFLTMTLIDVVPHAEDVAVVPEPPTFHYKIMPASGPNLGTARVDGEYGTVATMPSAAGSGRREKRSTADTATIKFTDLEDEELELAFPTLANVIRGLRDVKIGEILSAGIRSNVQL